MPRASQHGPFRPPALKKFFKSNLNFKGFYKVNRITARVGNARDTSGIVTFREKHPEATLPNFKLKFENSENKKANRVKIVVFILHQIKRRATFLGAPGMFSIGLCSYYSAFGINKTSSL